MTKRITECNQSETKKQQRSKASENVFVVKLIDVHDFYHIDSHPLRIVRGGCEQSRRWRRGPFRRIDGNRHGVVWIVICDSYSASAAQQDRAKCAILLTA